MSPPKKNKNSISISIPKIKLPFNIKSGLLAIFIITSILKLIPDVATLMQWNEVMNLNEVIQVQLNQQHFSKDEGQIITKNTYQKHVLDGDTNSKIIIKVYPGNDIYIHTMYRDGEENLSWVPSQKSLERIRKSVPTASSLFKRLLNITNAFARQPLPWNIPFKNLFIRWEKLNIIALYERHYINGQIWRYLYDIRHGTTYAWRRIR